MARRPCSRTSVPCSGKANSKTNVPAGGKLASRRYGVSAVADCPTQVVCLRRRAIFDLLASNCRDAFEDVVATLTDLQKASATHEVRARSTKRSWI